jgi:hypothetical protein
MALKLFIKTWVNDWQWVKQAMISVNKTCRDEVHWNICIDDGTAEEFAKVCIQVTQESPKKNNILVKEVSTLWPDAMKIKEGYLRQQWIKMNANRMMGDHIFWIWDSDLIAQKVFQMHDFCGFGGKPIYWFSQYNSILGGSDDNAHRSRIQMIKDIYGVPDVPFEWMRCIPIPQIGGILRHASETSYWKKAFDMLVAGDARFSEFNVIGQFCHQYFPDAFDWRNTHNYPGKTFSGPLGDKNFFVSQGYSWNGMPESVSEFVKKL